MDTRKSVQSHFSRNGSKMLNTPSILFVTAFVILFSGSFFFLKSVTELVAHGDTEKIRSAYLGKMFCNLCVVYLGFSIARICDGLLKLGWQW